MKKLLFVKPDLFLPNAITIVGSSKNILKKKNGKKIDSSKYIVRFNLAKTEGFELFTGSKTNMMVINNHVYHSLKKIKSKLNDYLIISPHEVQKFQTKLNFYFSKKKTNQYFLALKFINKFDIFLSLLKILIKKNFSVGFCFILLCISSGIKVNIYGFDLEEDMVKREHYYKKLEIFII